jgi:hypothetical protein
LAEVEPDRFEPLDILIRELNEAIILSSENTFSRKRDFIKKIGSNLFLRGRALDVKLENRWQTLMDWKRDLPTPWSKMSPDRKRVSLCTLRDKVRLQSEAPPEKKSAVEGIPAVILSK